MVKEKTKVSRILKIAGKAGITMARMVKDKKGILYEFKEFAMRGSVVDLAVGVIIGAAFQAIVNSLVKDVIMPLIGWVFGDIDFSNLFFVLGKLPANVDESKLSSLSYVRDTLGVAVFAYGALITAIINFIIMAFVIFWLVKILNKLKQVKLPLSRAGEEEEEVTPTTKDCPYCISEIAIKATRCPHCTSVLEE